MRIDGEAGVASREAPLLGVEAQLLADNVHQIRAVAPVDHRELRIELQMRRVMPQEPVCHGVKSAGPGQPLRQHLAESAQRFIHGLLDDVAGTAAHFLRSAPAEGQHQDARRIHAIHREVGDAVREGIGLAGSGAGDDQQWPGSDTLLLLADFPEGHRFALGGIQSGHVRGCRHAVRTISDILVAMTTDTNTRSSTQHFQGRVVSVTVDDVTLPNGRQAQLEVVHHPGGAAIVAINDLEQMCLLRQYRYVAGGWIWELPAGKLEPAEPPQLTARRELTEEAGVVAADWESLGSVLSSPGVFTEVIHLYLARGLSAARSQLEDSEVIEVHWVSFRQACDMALSGELRDAKTVIGVLRAAHQLGMTLTSR